MLKFGDVFVVSDVFGDIGGYDDGLFVDDMCVLLKWCLMFGGCVLLLLLGVMSVDNVLFIVYLMNCLLLLFGGYEMFEGVIYIECMCVFVGDVLYEVLMLMNYGVSEVEVLLLLLFVVDFKDMFEVCGM